MMEFDKILIRVRIFRIFKKNQSILSFWLCSDVRVHMKGREGTKNGRFSRPQFDPIFDSLAYKFNYVFFEG